MRSEHRPQVDFASLSAEVQVAMPDATAAILVGSAVTRTHSISDLDVTAFSAEIPPGTDRALSFTHRSKPVHVVAYHPDYFDLIFADGSLYLLYYRELRKLREGRVLFDKQGFIKRLLKVLSAKPPPREQLRPLVSRLLATPEPRSRAEFLLAVERLAFCWLHSSAEYRYAKPKWLLEDSRAVRSPALGLLLEKVSQEFLDHNNPDTSAAKLKNCGRKFLPATSGPGLHFANNLSDAGGLLAAGRTLDAVWPLRMAGAMLAEALAGELETPYSGIGDLGRFTDELSDTDSELSGLLENLFLLNHDVAPDLRAQYAAALQDFDKEWNRVLAIPAVPTQTELSSAGSVPEFVSGNGLWLQDTARETYLDGVSGTFNLPFGYSHPKLTAAVADQLSRLTHISSAFADAPAKSLIARLARHAGGKLDSGLVRDCTGSTAIECAVKIAQKYTGGSDVITLYYSHHGQTLFTSAISNDSSRRLPFPAAATPGVVRVPAPYCHRCFYKQERSTCGLLCADRIEEIVEHASQGPLAALIVEPILGNGGNITLPLGYGKRLREYCNQAGILLIADEVQTGLGRTGEVLASPSSGLDPDVIVLAKNLGGIGLPIGAVLARAEVMTLLKTEHSFTSGGNLLAIAAAHATLDLLEAPGFMQEVRRKGAILGELLDRVGRRHGCIGEVRGRGFMWGMELEHADGSPAPELVNQAIQIALTTERLILRGSRYGRGNALKVRPALIATDDELREIADRLDRVLAQLERVGPPC